MFLIFVGFLDFIMFCVFNFYPSFYAFRVEYYGETKNNKKMGV